MSRWFDILYRSDEPSAKAPVDVPGRPDVSTGSPVMDEDVAQEKSGRESLQPTPPLPQMPSRWVLELQKSAFHLRKECVVGQAGSRAVAFSGMQNGGGTSTISYLLAHYLAAETPDARVLYIDFSMDQKRPAKQGVDLMFRIDQAVPENFLMSNPLAFMKVSVRPGENRSVINCSRWFHEFLKISRNHCDWIVVDVPPFFSTPESYTVSQLCDGTVLVLKSGETRHTALNGLVADLEQVGIRLLGAVMNFREYPIPRWLLKYI